MAEIQGIQFDVKGNADNTVRSLDRLIDTLLRLKSVSKQRIGTFSSVASGLKSISSNKVTQVIDAQKVSRELRSVDREIASMQKTIDKLKESIGGGKLTEQETEEAKNRISEYNNILSSLFEKRASILDGSAYNINKDAPTESTISKWGALAGRLKDIASISLGGALKGLTAPFHHGIKSVSQFASKLSDVASGLKRILFYRTIRRVIKEIAQAFAEGVQHLYDWSRAMRDAGTGDMGRFANNMDDAATSLAYFKNSIAAAAAPLMNVLAPAINAVTNAVVALLNAINQLLARLTGQSSWTRATRQAQEYGDAVGGAGGAAKEALRYLAPFDELNVLPSQHSGGGGGGLEDDIGGLFEEMEEFEDGISDFADRIRSAVESANWRELGTILGDKVNEIVNGINWSGLGTTVGEKINALFTTKYWALETINFTNIGSKIAEFLNNAISNIDFGVIGASIVQKFTILGDLIIGAVEGINWTQVGESIGSYVRGAFNKASEWLNGLNFYDLGYGLVTKLNNLFGGMDFSSTVQSLKNAISAAFKAAGNFLDGVFDNLEDMLGVDITFGISDLLFEDKTDWTAKDWIDHIAQAIGPVAGAVIGSLIGGGPGAMFGGTIGLALSMLIQSIGAPRDGSKLTTKDWIDKIALAIAPVAGTVIGSLVGGGPGAAFGGAIGLALALTISSIGDPKDESGWTAAKWQGAITSVLLAVGGAAVGLFFAPGLKGALLGASIGIGIALAIKSIGDPTDESGWDGNKWMDALEFIFAPISGMLLGWKVGKTGGAEMGLLLGIGVGFALEYLDNKVQKNGEVELTKDDWVSMIIASILPAAGYIAGLVLAPGTGAALIGATIGISLAFALVSVEPPDPISEFENGDAGWFWRTFAGINYVPTIQIPVEFSTGEYNLDQLYWNLKRQWDDLGLDDFVIKIRAGHPEDVAEDMREAFEHMQMIATDGNYEVYLPVGLVPDDWDGSGTVGGGQTVNDFLRHRRGDNFRAGVGLKQDGWSSVSNWLSDPALMGKTVGKAISLVKSGWTYVSEWLKDPARSGGVVNKAIGLVKSGWTYISEWLKNTARSGGSVNKPIGLGKSGWSDLGTWLKKTDQYGGPVSKKVTLETVMSTIAATLEAMLFVGVWNSLKDKTITLTVQLDNQAGAAINNIKGAWNNMVSAWRSVPILANKSALWYLASGGIINKTGQMFVARENGPELVGSYGNKSAVMNNRQIVESVSAGVARAVASVMYAAPSAYDSDESEEDALYEAFVRAMTDTGFGDVDVNVNLDSDNVYKSVVRRNRANTRMTGVNAMA